MNSRSGQQYPFDQLDALAAHASRRHQTMSPNDVLVQISLPVVLILAIATRLITIGQGLAIQNRGPVILDLWKQQLILRIDRVLDNWEKASGLPEFTDFGRVYWSGRWPDDSRFRQLCRQALELADLDKLKLQLYLNALRYRPTTTNEAGGYLGGGAFDLYDPQVANAPANIAGLPPECIIDASRRQYALQHIEERCRQWNMQIEGLQWKLIERVVASMPAEDNLTNERLAVQMKNIVEALDKRGYPLLPGVRNEYTKEP